MKKYIGITIGPIFDTMSLVSSPAALWASSYIFSCVSKKICEYLISKYGVKEENIISPFYDQSDDLLNRNDGVGLFPDRIIFEKPENFKIEIVNSIADEVIKYIDVAFQINDIKYLKSYLMISAAEYEAENPILSSGKILDSLELSKSFVSEETQNPILSIFNSEDGGKNEKIKTVVKNLGIINWQLLKGENIKDLGSIAWSSNDGLKYNDYFAVVRSDGDNMSKLISSLDTKESFNKFSKTCLEYCSEAAEAVKKFGGITIYAGGDDLLAIIPCRNKNNETVFDFAKAINAVFEGCFKEYAEKAPLSLSTAFMVCYKKYPLYEAIEKSADLLFGTAKSRKNCVAVNFQKHSGQSEGMIIGNDSLDEVIKLQEKIFSNSILKESKLDSSDRILLSASQKLSLFKTLFDSVSAEQVDNVFSNTFDSDFHKDNVFVGKDLPQIFKKMNKDTFIPLVSDNECNGDEETKYSRAVALNYLLRILKFYVEKGGKK